jgi:alpha-galactosidase
VTGSAGRPQAIVTVDDGALALTVSVGQDQVPWLSRLGPADPAGRADLTDPAGPANAAGPADPAGPADVAGPAGLADPARPAPPPDDPPDPVASTGDGHPALARLPLVDVLTPGTGRSWSGPRHAESVLGPRLRYRGHTQRSDGPWQDIVIDLADDLADSATGLRAQVCYRILTGAGVLRAWVELVNEGPAPVIVESVTSFLCGALPAGGTVEDLDLVWAESDWLAEGRWQRRWLHDALPDLNRRVHTASPRGCAGFTSRGSWSSAVYPPMAALVSRRTGACWCWQIEHNGPWRWEVGDRRDGAYLALLGPSLAEHHWRQSLEPGASLRTVPVAVAVSGAGFEDAVGAMTRYRRAARRPHSDHRRLPVIFNDYMNTLMGNPSTQRLLPLISAAAEVGAEYFCIDAGWYDTGAGWWDSAGDWRPAPARFPGGIAEVLDRIRALGMVPGLWLEPEVAGVRTAAARELPAEAFFHRGGVRVVEHGRYHLDLRHPAAVKHLDETIDYLVGDLGVGYLKLDYNIRIDPGPDSGGQSAGAGLLGHSRALLDWLDRVLTRHPGLTLENCASGGMRADYAMLARLQLQSTSDQQDLLRYPAISAAAPAAMTPEQAGIWAYPQPELTPEQNAFTLCGALLGRVHLSGHLDQMAPDQRRLVADAVGVYKAIRADLAEATPFWPLGLPGWDDSWVALGLRTAERSYVLVWRRGPQAPAGAPVASHWPALPGRDVPGDPEQARLPVPHLAGWPVRSEVLFPDSYVTRQQWDPDRAELVVALPAPPAACLVRLTARAR